MEASGALVVCPTPIGNLADVTLRVLDELRAADAVACEDTRHSRTLLSRYDIRPQLVALHEHNERARTPALLARIAAGERICLLTDAGFPAVSDPGAHLISATLDAGLPMVVLPGPSAVTTALVAAGEGGGGFQFAGFLPRGPGSLDRLLDRLDTAGLPVVAFESPRRLPATLKHLAVRDPNRRGAVCRELTKVHEEVARATLAELAERFREPPKGEVTLVLAAPEGADKAAMPPAELLAELAGAMGARRAAAVASALTGLPRNRLYREITSR
jgi:16S rRNA (cytidine1402-2'-O)-methyltransferase